MRRVGTAVVLGTVVSIVLLPAAPSTATFSGRNGRVAFATDSGSSAQVVRTIKRDGTGMRPVAWNAVDPNWSPDGTKIAFTRIHANGPTACSIQISNPDGSGIVDLTGGRAGCERGPSFTPDGRRIVFIRDCHGCQEAIWRMNLHGGARTRIRRVPSHIFEAADPNVSPGGRTIAFQGARSDSLRALYTIKMNGTHLRRLTPFAMNVGVRIDWAPSGRHIVFTQYKIGGPGNIAVIRPDGSGLVFVTHYDGDIGAGGGVYSPNGRWILYRRQNNVVGRYSMWKMHPDGSDRIRIRGIGVNFCCLDWGPQPK
jgi:Tol biopolymer transport system component